MTEKTGSRGTGSLGDENAPMFEVVEGGICNRCLHYRANTVTCAAFPKGVPTIILLGKFIHTEPFPGDQGIRFEPKVKMGGAPEGGSSNG
jgi:hypothetical protein